MVFEPNFKKVTSSIRTHVGTTQSVIELKLPTNDGEIKEVYSVGASSSIVSTEVAGNVINFVGLVDFQTIYEGSGLSSLDYTAEFRDRFDNDKEVKGELIVSSNVVQVSESVVNGEIRVTAIVEVSIDAIESREYSVLTAVDSKNAYKTTNDFSWSTYLGRAFEKLDVSGDLEIVGAKAVYRVTPCVRLNEVLPKDNYIEAKGVMGLDISYADGEDVSTLKSTYKELDFAWEVAFDGMSEESGVQTALSIISNETKVSSIVNDDGITLSLDIPIEFSGYVFETNTTSIIDDVYLESNYLSITSENIDTIESFGTTTFKDNILGSAEIKDDAPFIDDVLSVSTNNLVLARDYIEDDRLVVEGVATATVVYYTKETMSATSVEIEMPFVVEEKVALKNAKVVTLCLSNIGAKSRRGKELEVSGELHVYADTYDEKEDIVISGIELGEEKPMDDCSLYIYIVKPNETVWDIAKNMNVSSELIMEQNPNMTMPLVAGDKLIIYKPKLMEF